MPSPRRLHAGIDSEARRLIPDERDEESLVGIHTPPSRNFKTYSIVMRSVGKKVFGLFVFE